MNPFAWLRSVGSALFRRSRLEGDLDDELRAHLQDRANDLRRSGVSRREAERLARLEFGGYQKFKQECREAMGAHFVETLVQDVRYGLRMLGKSPAFTIVAVLTLALGIGSVTFIFSAVYGVILNTFPFRDANQVTSFTIQNLARPGGREGLSMQEFLYFREHSHVFQDFSGEYGGFGTTPVRYTTGHATYQFDADFLSVNSFKFFGVNPLMGRLPTADDVKPAATPVFVMGYKLWHAQFNEDPKIVGRSFTLNGVPTTLVGIMPPRFRWAWVDVWLPFSIDPAEALTNPDLKNRFLYTVGRLKPGVTLKAAAADLDLVAHQYAKIVPRSYPKRFTVTAASLADRVTGGFKELMYPLLAAVLMLLLIACSNIANLLVSRATVREKEIAVRVALGATRGRLVRQLLVESLLLAAAGCFAGCLLAWVAIKLVVPLIPYNMFPQEAVITLNAQVLGAALLVAVISTVLCGLVPALRSVRVDIRSRLAADARGAGTDLRHGKLRSVLVIAEVALSIVLLIGAGLMMRTFWNIKNIDLGFDPHNILEAQLSFPQGSVAQESQQANDQESQQTVDQEIQQQNIIARKVLDRVQSLPGVSSAALVSTPPAYGGMDIEITIPGKTHSERWTALLNACSEHYFELLRLPVFYGRVFSRGDLELARPVAVVSQTFVLKYFGGENPIGQSVHFPVLDQTPKFKGVLFEIIGVVADAKNGDPRKGPSPEVYVPYTIAGANGDTLLVRSLVSPGSLIPTIRRQLSDIDSDLAIVNPATVEGMLQRDVFSPPQFEFVILTTFAAIALALLVAGIFSVMAYTVSLQTHEIGVRMALGAQPEGILRMVLAKGALLALIGIACGVCASLAVTKFLRQFLLGIQPTDLVTFIVVSMFVVVVALLACWLPARRAMRVDPMVALRYE